MTCIVALKDKGRIWVGGDSAGISGWSLQIRADEKVFFNGDYLMGFTNSFRMGQLLRYTLQAPLPDINSLDKFMTTTFVDEVRKCLKNGGYARKENEVESGGCFIVAYKDNLWEIQSDYQVAKMVDDFTAIGCGQDIALGSLFSTTGVQSPEKRILKALEAAERFSAGVRGPFIVKHTWIA